MATKRSAFTQTTPVLTDDFAFIDDPAGTPADAKCGFDDLLALLTPNVSHNVRAETGATYTLALGDQNGIVTMSNASANTLTIPLNSSVAFPVGTKVEVWRLGAGVTTISADTSVTLQGNGGSASAGSCDIQTRYGGATLTKIAANTWMVGGDIDEVA